MQKMIAHGREWPLQETEAYQFDDIMDEHGDTPQASLVFVLSLRLDDRAAKEEMDRKTYHQFAAQ